MKIGPPLCLQKDRDLYATFMDLKKAYDKTVGNAIWHVMQVYGEDGC